MAGQSCTGPIRRRLPSESVGFADFALKRLARRQHYAKQHCTGDVNAGRLRVVDEQTTAGNMTDPSQRGARQRKGQSSTG
jgi:hypothetical protein